MKPQLDQPARQLQAPVQSTLELSLKPARQRYLDHCRARGQPNKANGFYCRSLDTTFGRIPDLRVARLRHGRLPQLWLERYQRRWQKADRLRIGLLPRRFEQPQDRQHSPPPLRLGFSASLVSRLAEHLHSAPERSKQCVLQDASRARIIDGAWYRFRQLFGPQRVVLAVLGVQPDHSVVLWGFHVARSPSALDAGRLLPNLKERGLAGRKLQRIVVDGAGGIEAALAEIHPWVPILRCWGISCSHCASMPPTPRSPAK